MVSREGPVRSACGGTRVPEKELCCHLPCPQLEVGALAFPSVQDARSVTRPDLSGPSIPAWMHLSLAFLWTQQQHLGAREDPGVPARLGAAPSPPSPDQWAQPGQLRRSGDSHRLSCPWVVAGDAAEYPTPDSPSWRVTSGPGCHSRWGRENPILATCCASCKWGGSGQPHAPGWLVVDPCSGSRWCVSGGGGAPVTDGAPVSSRGRRAAFPLGGGPSTNAASVLSPGCRHLVLSPRRVAGGAPDLGPICSRGGIWWCLCVSQGHGPTPAGGHGPHRLGRPSSAPLASTRPGVPGVRSSPRPHADASVCPSMCSRATLGSLRDTAVTCHCLAGSWSVSPQWPQNMARRGSQPPAPSPGSFPEQVHHTRLPPGLCASRSLSVPVKTSIHPSDPSPDAPSSLLPCLPC